MCSPITGRQWSLHLWEGRVWPWDCFPKIGFGNLLPVCVLSPLPTAAWQWGLLFNKRKERPFSVDVLIEERTLTVTPKRFLFSPRHLHVLEMGSPLWWDEGSAFQWRRLTERISESPSSSLSEGDNTVCFAHLPNKLGPTEGRTLSVTPQKTEEMTTARQQQSTRYWDYYATAFIYYLYIGSSECFYQATFPILK
jgi:hypothetical protein